jgi:hypothetical protein
MGAQTRKKTCSIQSDYFYATLFREATAALTTSPPTGADAQSLKGEEPRVATVSHTNILKKGDLNQIFNTLCDSCYRTSL